MRKNRKKGKELIITLIVSAGLLVFLLISVDYTRKGNVARQKESLEKAIQRDITYSYATTGSYPKTLDYIERVYGLSYDTDLFSIEYEVRGSKIPPIVTVNVIEEKNDNEKTN